jgi:hypothetical protein
VKWTGKNEGKKSTHHRQFNYVQFTDSMCSHTSSAFVSLLKAQLSFLFFLFITLLLFVFVGLFLRLPLLFVLDSQFAQGLSLLEHVILLVEKTFRLFQHSIEHATRLMITSCHTTVSSNRNSFCWSVNTHTHTTETETTQTCSSITDDDTDMCSTFQCKCVLVNWIILSNIVRQSW